jgi:hypothetical protein
LELIEGDKFHLWWLFLFLAANSGISIMDTLDFGVFPVFLDFDLDFVVGVLTFFAAAFKICGDNSRNGFPGGTMTRSLDVGFLRELEPLLDGVVMKTLDLIVLNKLLMPE